MGRPPPPNQPPQVPLELCPGLARTSLFPGSPDTGSPDSSHAPHGPGLKARPPYFPAECSVLICDVGP